MRTSTPLFRSADLGGGVRIHLRRTKAFKTVAARLAFHADLDDDTAARALLPRVLGRGTHRLPSLREFQIELDRLFGATLGGDTRKIGERQVVQFRADWVGDKLAGAPLFASMGSLLREALHDPAVDGDGALRADVIEQERKMAADEAAAVFDDKGRYARHRLLETMCRGEPYARPSSGRLEEIRAVTPDDVRRVHRTLLARAPLDVFLVGDVTWSQARRFVAGLGFTRDRRPWRLRRTVRKRPSRVRTVRERQEVVQAKFELGFRCRLGVTSPLYPALVLMNALFGGSPVGLLFQKVREEASLCYSIGSGVERTKGLVLVHAGIDAANYTRARRLVLRQLDELRAGRIPPEAEAQARRILLSSLNSLRDSPGGMIEFGLERAVNGAVADLDGLVAAIAAVNARDVARAARAIELDTVYLLADGPAGGKR